MIIIQLDNTDKTLAQIERRLRSIAPIVRSSLDNWGSNYLVPMLYRSANEEGQLHNVRGNNGLYGGVHWDELGSSNTGILTIIESGVYIDSMEAHYVNIRKDRPNLLNWALQCGNAEIVSKAQQILEGKISKYAIYVKPHPWIKRGISNSKRILPEVLKADLMSANI